MSDLRPRNSRLGRPSAIARHGRLRVSNTWRTIVKVLVAGVAVVAVSGVSLAAYAAWDIARSVKPSVSLVDSDGKTITPSIGALDGAFNVLAAGSDSGGGNAKYGDREESLNDVTMLLHVSADHKHATVVSLPRDLLVSIPSCPNPDGGTFSAMSSQKINNSLSYGGLACTVLTVQELTGLPIEYAAEIEFDGVIAMSNAVGGVPVCLAGRLDDDRVNPPLHLAAGNYKLKGGLALSYLRTRHSIGDGSDLGRISNQQSFMSSLVRTIRTADTLGNPTKVYALAKAAASNMILSDSLNSITTMASMAVALKDIDLDKVVFVQYPNHYTDGMSAVEPSVEEATQLMRAIMNDSPIVLTGSTGVGSQAKNVSSTPDPSPTEAASAPPSAPSDAAVLPDTVHGQTAAEETCAKPYDG